MSGNRGHAKQLERQKRKRAEIRKKHASAKNALRPSALLKRASDFPIDRAWLSLPWRDSDEYMPGLVSAVITRRAPGGLLVATALVDRTCLGIKDAFGTMMTELELGQYLRQMQESIEVEPVEPSTCMSVVHHAIDYAASLGFQPHADFPSAMFEPRPEVLEDTPLAKPTRPFYGAGPDDNVPAVLARLNAAVGNDFRFMIASSDQASRPVDAKDTMRLLQSWRATQQVEELLQQSKHDEAEAACEALLGDDSVLEHEAMEMMARIREARGDVPGAIDWLRRAIEIGRRDLGDDVVAEMEQQLARLAQSV